MNISYDCEEIIKELKEDIEEFGNLYGIAIFKKVADIDILVDYLLEVDNLNTKNLKANEIGIKLKYSDILAILEKQNTLF